MALHSNVECDDMLDSQWIVSRGGDPEKIHEVLKRMAAVKVAIAARKVVDAQQELQDLIDEAAREVTPEVLAQILDCGPSALENSDGAVPHFSRETLDHMVRLYE